MWAAIEVLRGKRKPMTAREIYAEITERKLAPGLKGKTPEQTIAAQLAVRLLADELRFRWRHGTELKTAPFGR
jgi:hypothetical protein